MIIGHKNIIDYFDKAKKHHAYCFVGTAHVGKSTVARYISSKTLNTEFDKLLTSPDFISVERGINEKTGKTRKDITVKQVRNIISQLSKSSFTLEGYKVGIIRDAHLLSPSGANALLKTLEEPAKKTIIILTTTDEKLLPETILSRCHSIYFNPVSNKDIYNHLVKLGCEEGKAQKYTDYSLGLPGLAINWYNDEDNFVSHEKEIRRFCDFLEKPFFAKLKAVEDLFGDKTDHILTREHLGEVLDLWLLLVRDILLGKAGKTPVHKFNVSKTLDSSKLIEVEEQIVRAKQDLLKNIHPRLLVEHILLHTP